MKLLSFNCQGLASPPKKSALKRLVTLHQLEVVLLQEMMANEHTTTQSLSTPFLGWAFLGLDACGRSGGLVIGWLSINIKPLNSSALEQILVLEMVTLTFSLWN